MNEHELLWAILPEGLEAFFDVENFQKSDRVFRITLIEKNTIPTHLPEEYRGKTVINTILKPIMLDCFPIQGRKTEIVLRRRWWKFEGVEKMLKRDIKLCSEGTKLEKEFADFLKEFS